MQFEEIMQNFQKTQEQINKAQEELQNKCVEASAGGGKVTVTANGKQEIVKIAIDPEMIDPDPDEISLLEDMIAAATNQALKKSRELAQSEMSSEITKLAGNLDIGNLMNMFRGR